MNNKWTANQIPDLSGKKIIVTGANSGIGYEAAKAFARKGAEVIFASRNRDKAQQAIDKIITELPAVRLRLIELNLASLESVNIFVETYQDSYDRLDVLLNNAGIMMVPFSKTEDGFENTLGTNHLGHFALTGLLLDTLINTPEARVVNVSSNAHHAGEIDFSDLSYDNGQNYTPIGAYGRSKLANLLFTYELQRRFDENGLELKALAAHPGLSNTALVDHVFEAYFVKALRPLMGLAVQSAAMGALPSLRAAVDPTATGGQYYGPGGKGERSGYPVIVNSNKKSHSLGDARQLWVVSQELTGVQYLS
jgi:NAD(P)-dependent dehydrogenase (short-subunit alcohol dehydrogenase family)